MAKFGYTILAVSLWAGLALGEVVPCSPVTIVGLQGRPIVGAQATITTLAGAAVTAYSNLEGTLPFTGAIPVDGILKIYTSPGTYTVNVVGQGLSKTYTAICSQGVGEGSKLLSIDRNAELLRADTGTPAHLQCAPAYPCVMVFMDGYNEQVFFDFITPSYAVTNPTLLLSWMSDAGQTFPANAYWVVDWCEYDVGEAPCWPDGTNLLEKTSRATTPNARIDVEFAYTTTWTADSHIVFNITRQAAAPIDTLDSRAVKLENVRLEVSR